jgi:hypothetical protein
MFGWSANHVASRRRRFNFATSVHTRFTSIDGFDVAVFVLLEKRSQMSVR